MLTTNDCNLKCFPYTIEIAKDGEWLPYDNADEYSEALSWATGWTKTTGDMCRITCPNGEEHLTLLVDGSLIVVD